MGRRQSIFASTKAIMQSTASVFEESTGYLVDELKASRTINREQNAVELMEVKKEIIDTKIGIYREVKDVLEADKDLDEFEKSLLEDFKESLK